MGLPKVVHDAVDVAYNHHERLDGRGYPRGLVGYQIPYNAKIFAIADTYDAITSYRAYDSARSSMNALEIIHRYSGELFAISKELPDGTFGVCIQRFIENGLVLGY